MNTFFIIHRLFFALLAIAGSFLLGLFFEKQAVAKLKKFTQKTNLKFDSILLDSFQGISTIWFFLGGFYLALPILPFNKTAIAILEKALAAILLMTFTTVISRLSVRLLRVYSTRNDDVSPLTSLFEFLINVFIFSIGILITLQSIGIAITPLLTALGVGGVSLGLALQSTLANLMSGINIITSKKVKPGDYIELKTGESGYVTDVELKYTIIQEITNNFLVIPNSKILSSSFRNFSLPDKEMLIPIEIDVSYDNDLEKVEIITLQVAREILQQTSSAVLEHNAFVRYHKFDRFNISFTVYLKIKEKEFFEHIALKHKFIKKLHERYQLEKIKIFSPTSFLRLFE
jgi:small-conductance mechanosensitive channel